MTASDASAQLRADLLTQAAYLSRREQILAGDCFPELDELRSGLPFFKGQLTLDIKTFLQSALLDRSHDPAVRDALQLAYDNPVRDTLRNAASLIEFQQGLKRRLDLYACYLGDDAARDRMIRRAFEDAGHPDLAMASNTLALGFGLAFMSQRLRAPTAITTAFVDEYVERGRGIMLRVSDLHVRSLAAENAGNETFSLEDLFAAASRTQPEVKIEDGIPDAYLGGSPPEPKPEVRGAIVVPKLDRRGSSTARDIMKAWDGLDGTPLPIVQVGDVAAAAARLVSRYPWAEELVYTLCSDLDEGGDAVFRHSCIVGDPGTGKSAFVAEVLTEFGLPVEIFSLAGVADSSAMGTSSRYSSAEESAVLKVIRREKKASVGMVWDELEKVADGTNNGSAQDALLPFLVPHQAKRLRDPALNVAVDLSYVSHFATSNNLSKVPAPLKDRLRILRMPSPGWQHIGLLSERVLDDIAKRRRHPRAFYPPLAQDEVDVIKDQWFGGSIRRIERYVEIIVAGRDKHQQFGRA